MRTFVLLLFAATLHAQNPTPVGTRGVNFYSLEKEKVLGEQIAADYRRQFPLIASTPVHDYLDALGQRLAAQTPAPAFTYTLELVDDDQTFVHEAPAFPGGPIFVPAALILAAADEDELAGMLAHSIAHIAMRHRTRELTKAEIVNTATVPLIYMNGWSGYAIRQGAELAIPLGFVQFQRKGELESDAFAARILAAAGYDPQALYRYLDRLQPADPTLRKVMVPYPDKTERLAALQKVIDQLPPATYSAHPGLDAIRQTVVELTARPAKAPPRLAR